MRNKRYYYPALDSLRFIAFLMVFTHHAFLDYGSTNKVMNFLVHANLWVGIDLFFVLSGFLITLHLLRERQQYKSFKLKHFWIRRSLRIWPLYYLALFFGFFLIPYLSQTLLQVSYPVESARQQLANHLFGFAVFLGNWSLIFFDQPFLFRGITHLWAVSLEVQFYVFWPLCLLFIKKLKLGVYVSFVIILLSALLRFVLISNGAAPLAVYRNTFTRIDSFIFGALLAFVYIYKPEVTVFFRQLTRVSLQLVVISLFIVYIYTSDVLYPLGRIKSPAQVAALYGYPLFDLFMVYFIIVAIEGNVFFARVLHNKALVFLGKLSFAAYIWHILALDISAKLLHQESSSILKTMLALALVLIMSICSYYGFELFFLKLKKKFSLVLSRPT